MNSTLHRLARPATLLAALLGLGLSQTALAAPPTYTVNFTTPWQVGQTYATSSSGTQRSTTVVTMGAQKVQEQTQQSSAQLEAEGKALEIHPHGGLRKAQFTIRSLRASTNNAPAADALPKGAVVVAEKKDGDTAFTVDGKPATPQQINALKLVIALDDETRNDQLLFGTDKPVAVGETWSPDTDRIKTHLGKELGEIRNTTASMRLDAITGAGATQVASVSGTVLFDGIQPPLPPGLTLKSGKFEAKLTGKIPAQRKASTRKETLDGSGQFVATAPGPEGNEVTLTVNLAAQQVSTLTFP